MATGSSVCSILDGPDSKQRQTSLRTFFVSAQRPRNDGKRPSLLPSTTASSLPDVNDTSTVITTDTMDKVNSFAPSQHYFRPSGALQNIDPSISLARTSSNRKPPSRGREPEQLYLDFGQRNFGATNVCSTCGMLFVQGVAADLQRHQSVCQNYSEGVPWRTRGTASSSTAHSTRVCCEWTLPPAPARGGVKGRDPKRSRTLWDPHTVASVPDRACVIEIRPKDSTRPSKKLDLIRMIVDQELGFASNATKKNDLTTYLCILNNRVVGMVLAEEITAGYRLLPHSNSENASSSLHFGVTRSACPSKAVLGIYQLWVHHKHRNRGIASVLVDVARKNMFFGYSSIPVQLVAFSSPTESGLAFAQQYYARNNQSQQCQSSHNGMTEGYDVLVYDCC